MDTGGGGGPWESSLLHFLAIKVPYYGYCRDTVAGSLLSPEVAWVEIGDVRWEIEGFVQAGGGVAGRLGG